MAEEKNVECTGTARATHEISEYEMLEYDYGEETALSVTTKAFQRSFPDITRDDVKSTIKVIRAARSGEVNIAAERNLMEKQAEKVASQMLECISELEEIE
jgi:hypothetical protein